MSILKREIIYDNTGGFVRFADWALVTTTLGVMAEPFLPNDRHITSAPFDEFDPTDEMARIDSIRCVPQDRHPHYFSGGDHALNGGPLHPRNGSR